jgi:hypothetical protein
MMSHDRAIPYVDLIMRTIGLCAAALTLCFATSACSAASSTRSTDTLPHLGDTKGVADRLLRGKRMQGDEVAYNVYLINQFVRLSLMYSKYSDGSLRIMQINLRKSDGIGDEALREAKRQILPDDVRVLREHEVNAALLDDAKGMQSGEDMAFLDSKRLARRLESGRYYRRAWFTGACPDATPGIIEEYTSTDAGTLARIGFFAAYLDKCQYKILDVPG